MQSNTKTGSSIFDDLGVPRIINGRGWITALGGSVMVPEAASAMAQAIDCYVDLHDLNIAAGKKISQYTGAEAGLVVAGAGAGLMLQAAACIAGDDPKLIARLPNTRGLRNEVLLYEDHVTGYARCYRAAGAKVITWREGKKDPRVRLRSLVGPRTAAVAYVFHPWNSCPISLSEVVEIAHAGGVPVIVDAAVMLPPASNLTRFVNDGADMVTFSGGKGLRGPQSTGILCGKADLVEAARVNMSPHAGIGRPAKVCKEEIAGLVAALQVFVEADHEAELSTWKRTSQHILDSLHDIPGLDPRLEENDPNRQGPQAVIYFKPGWQGPDSQAVLERLAQRSPSIRIGRGNYADELFISPVTLKPGEEVEVADALHEELTREDR